MSHHNFRFCSGKFAIARMWFAWLTVFSLIAPILGCAKKQDDEAKEVVLVLCAASAASVVSEVAQEFENQNPTVDVKVSSSSTSSLARQIIAGIEADIFVAANAEWMNVVKDSELAEKSVDLLSNQMVLVVPNDHRDKIRSVEEFLTREQPLIALADENVPAGIYGRQILQSYGAYEALVENRQIVRGSNVRVSLSFVERGEVEAGIVYRTDALSSSRVTIVATFSPSTHARIVYPMAMLRNENLNPNRSSLFQFMQSQYAEQKFSDAGFEFLPKNID